MELPFLILLLVVIGGFGGVFWFLNKKLEQKSEESKDDKAMLLLQNQMGELQRTLDSRLHESARMIQKHSLASSNTIKEVVAHLVEVRETNKQVVDFADQLRSLQDILKNPKQRGVLGEYYLETILKNVFPPSSYQMQYEFKDGSIVDAVVFYQDRIVPIDSKFSLENYNRILESRSAEEREKMEKVFKQDLKTRIDETAKYVKPDEKTTGFAFMFIPAEAIYYDLLVNRVGAVKTNTRDLIEYAYKDKKVIIVSPTSFTAYLQTVLQGMKAQQIEKSAQEIIKKVQLLGKHLLAYDSYMDKLGNHLGTAVNSYNTAYKELGKIDKDVLRVGGKAMGIEAKAIEKPQMEAEDGKLL